MDQLNGIENYLGTAVGLHLQKFWISFAEVNVMMTLEWHFWRPESVKLALERRLEQPCGAKLALERRLEQPCGAKLALERRFGSPGGVKLGLGRRLGGQIMSSWPWNGDWDAWNGVSAHLATPTCCWKGVRDRPWDTRKTR